MSTTERAGAPGRPPLPAVLRSVLAVEVRLFLREPLTLVLGVAMPSVVLFGMAAIPALREPSPDFGGMRFIDFWAPTALVLGLCLVGVSHLPAVIGTYRENGVLRRLSTTPVHPGVLLVAQLIIVLATMALSSLVLVVASWLVLDIGLPQRPLLFAVALVTGSASLVASGMLVAAVVPSARAANGVATLLYLVVMLVGGLFLPRFLLPEVLVRMGEFTPPGVQLLMDAWWGRVDSTNPHAVQLAVMAGITVLAAAAAARLFRWE
ncbi:ABC transporter permease [Nocardiopsis kunsanensis]|uniref:Transport permease protein n=1 Tax=Nocardiopsis kunsanensis TaxID=141693 RepID=A0A918XC44_9ACTN|nr:ABC transporter permease [Nocardiopsis kunsanensis]GHD25753.1 transport permease protein [Nocardiopsis kunsanensis]